MHFCNNAYTSTLYNFCTPLRERSKLQRNEFRRKGCFYPFREIHLAVGSLSPKGGAKIVQSRDTSDSQTMDCEEKIYHLDLYRTSRMSGLDHNCRLAIAKFKNICYKNR